MTLFELLLFILFFIISPAQIYASVVVNEIMPHPSLGVDWIELYSTESQEVDLSGWKIEDSTGILETFSEGTKIGSSSAFMQISKSNRLNNGGDTVRIKDKLGTVIDEKSYTEDPGIGITIGRYPDGTGNWGVLINASPNGSNSNLAPTATLAPSSTPTLTPTPKLSNTPVPSATSKPQNSATPTGKISSSITSEPTINSGVQSTDIVNLSPIEGLKEVNVLGESKETDSNKTSLPLLIVLLGGGVVCIAFAVFLSFKQIKSSSSKIS